jgi:hypothetical protein
MFKIKQEISSSWFKVIFAIWITVLLVYRISICFSYLPELSNGESNNIWKAINVANGKPIYTNPEELPLEVFQYTPISQLPIVGIAKLLNNKSVNYVYFVTAYGRLYELFANILLVIILYHISFKYLENSKHTSVTVALLILSLFTNPAFTVRPDATLLLLLGVSMWSYLKMEQSNRIKWTCITSFLIIGCFYTKQDGILIAGPIAIRLITLKKWKQFLSLSTISIGLLITSIIISPSLFGEHFYTCVFKGLKNTSSIQQIIRVFDRAYGFYMIHFVLGLICSIYFLFKNKKDTIALFAIASIFYFFVAVATTSKSGSWVNYYTPFIIFSTIVIFNFLSSLSFKKEILHPLFTTSFAILIACLFIFKQTYVYTSPFIKPNNGKVVYLTHFKNIINIKSKLRIKKTDNILTINQLDRNFLAENSIMINTEYYNYASYSYQNFKSNKSKNIDYIIYQEKDKPTLDYLLQFFKVKKENFKLIRMSNYIILQSKKNIE